MITKCGAEHPFGSRRPCVRSVLHLGKHRYGDVVILQAEPKTSSHSPLAGTATEPNREDFTHPEPIGPEAEPQFAEMVFLVAKPQRILIDLRNLLNSLGQPSGEVEQALEALDEIGKSMAVMALLQMDRKADKP